VIAVLVMQFVLKTDVAALGKKEAFNLIFWD
jgi:hypothetical protein